MQTLRFHVKTRSCKVLKPRTLTNANKRLRTSTPLGMTCRSANSRCRRQRAFDSPRYRTVTRLRRPEHHPSPCRIRHTARSGFGGRIGIGKRPGIGNGSPAPDDTGRASPRRGQHPNPRLKEKLSEHPGSPSTLPRPSPAPGWPALAAQKLRQHVLCSAVSYQRAILGYQLLSSCGCQSCTRWRSSSTFSAFRATTSATPS
jgi:hypothetical protein